MKTLFPVNVGNVYVVKEGRRVLLSQNTAEMIRKCPERRE